MTAFTWIASNASSLDTEPRALNAVYGDGYEQSIGDGINNVPHKWNLVFKGRGVSERAAIRAFLEGQGGTLAFDWTDPDGYVGRWKCRRWTQVRTSGPSGDFTLTFEEVFGA